MPTPYNVAATPTPIFPNGQQPSLLLYNPSGSTAQPIYVDSNSGVGAGASLEIHPGTSVQWNANTPLWAISPSGAQDLMISEEASNFTSAVDVANALIDSGLANDIAQQIALNGAPTIDVPLAINTLGIDYDVTKYSSVEVTFTVGNNTYPNGYAGGDLWALNIYYKDEAGNTFNLRTVTGHSTGNAKIVIPTYGVSMQFQANMLTNVSGSAYTFGIEGELSYRERNESIVVTNRFWAGSVGSDYDQDGDALASVNMTNTSNTYYPSYKAGPQTLSLLFNSHGSSGSTFEWAVRDAFTGFWLWGVISTSAANPAFQQANANIRSQPSVFISTTSTTSVNFQYSQIHE